MLVRAQRIEEGRENKKLIDSLMRTRARITGRDYVRIESAGEEKP